MPRFYYDKEVQTAAAKHGLDPALVKAVVLIESSGRTSAYRHEPEFWLRYMANKPSWKDAIPERVSSSYGLMQVMYTTALIHGFSRQPEHLFLPEVGLDFGCKHLKYLLDRCNGDEEMALAQYNGGMGGNMTRPLRNEGYALKVLRQKAML